MTPHEPLTHPLARRLISPITAAPVAVLVISACVFGFRGEVEIADEASLEAIETVQLHLPATSLVVAGESARTFIDWQGTFITLGGSGKDALASARKAELRWDTWARVGRLEAALPLEIRDITSLDHLDVVTASYLAHEIIGAGDVFVSGIDAYVSVALDGGSVEILGGTEQLHVTTARGNVQLSTSAAVDVYSGLGTVTIDAEAARDIEIDTVGAVFVNLTSASDIDVEIEGAGAIVVELDTAAHVGAGSYRRAIGSATTKLHVRSGGGRVELAMLPVSDP